MVAVLLFLAGLGLALGGILWMFVSLGRQGDERRRMIVTQAAAWSFVVMAGAMALEVVEQVVRSAALGQPMSFTSPLVRLMVMSWVYFISLGCLRRRHGG